MYGWRPLECGVRAGFGQKRTNTTVYRLVYICEKERESKGKKNQIKTVTSKES